MDGVPYGVPFWKLYRSAEIHLRKKLHNYIDSEFRGKSIFCIRLGLLSLCISLCCDRRFEIRRFFNFAQEMLASFES